MKRLLPLAFCLATLLLALTLSAQQKGKGKAKGRPAGLQWEIQLLHRDNNEACDIGDIDGDGHLDISAGEYWYRGPDFTQQLPVRKLMPFGADYLQNNSEFLLDVNGNGLLDVVAGAFTLPIVSWFENPGPGNYDREGWTAHQLIDLGTEQNEAAFLHDFDGDGVPEFVVNSWRPDAPVHIYRLERGDDGMMRPVKHVVAESGNGHGMGFGDVNGNGLDDIVFLQGWYECPPEGPFSGPWKWRDDFTLPHASCPILIVDLTGNGRSDIIWGDGHNYGLYWHEQLEPREDGTTVWRQHQIDKRFSQAHCLAWVDLDNDGQPELLTGKRYYAHSGRDPGAEDPTVVYYYKWNREARQWTRHTVSEAPAGEGPGIGLQIRTADLDGSGWTDIVVAGKSGTYILWNRGFAE